MDEIDWILRNTPEPEPLKPITSEYQRALIEALASRRAKLMIDGHRPTAVRLTPEEIREMVHYTQLSGPLFTIRPSEAPQVFGMSVVQTPGPIAIEDRFVISRN